MSKKKNAEAIWDYFRSKGYSEAATAGILGNAEQENSTFNPTLGTSDGPAYGLFQFEKSVGNPTKLQNWCKNKGLDYTSVKGQCAYVHAHLGSAFKSFSGKSNGWAFFTNHYGGPASTSAGDPWFSTSPKKRPVLVSTSKNGNTSYREEAWAWWGWEKITLKKFMASTDIARATQLFCRCYERGSYPRMDKRIEYAKKWYKEFTGKTPPANSDGEVFTKRINPKAKDLKNLKYWSTYNPGFETNPDTGNNCTWYAWGRFQEIAEKKLNKVPSGNAYNWVASARSLGYKTGTEPKLGAIICWSYGGPGGDNGNRPGHVAIVEDIKYDSKHKATKIEISQGGWSSGDMSNEPLYRGDGKVGFDAWHRDWGNTYFNGFIYQPNKNFSTVTDFDDAADFDSDHNWLDIDRTWTTYFAEHLYHEKSDKDTKNAALEKERKELIAGNTLKGMSLLAPSTFVESPFIIAKIGKYTFGSYNKTGVLAGDLAKTITFPNYMQSITINKINGALNTYTLNMTYPITPNNDPNLLDRVFSSVSNSRKIELSYGDYMLPSFIYRNEEAIITKVTSRVDFANQKIDYTVQCTSTALALQGKKFNFPRKHCKGSTLIKDLIKNTSYGIYDIFPGMKSIKALNKIASDDKEVDIPAYKQIDILTYINYIVACMTSSTNTGNTTLKNSVYQLIIMDDVDNNYGGAYFKVEKIGTTTRNIVSGDVYEVDIGYPSNALVTNFSVNTDNSWAILYNYSESISKDHYNYSIDNQGNVRTNYVSSPMVSPLSNRMTEQSKTWWTQMTRFPITATLTIKGLLRSAMLMNYVRINTYFYGQKHISSGLYVITKQEDRIDSSGYRTTLSLTRIAGDDDASWNIGQLEMNNLSDTKTRSESNKEVVENVNSNKDNDELRSSGENRKGFSNRPRSSYTTSGNLKVNKALSNPRYKLNGNVGGGAH